MIRAMSTEGDASIVRVVEDGIDDPHNHLSAISGHPVGTTLCGYAAEVALAPKGQVLDCPTCVRIIELCRSRRVAKILDDTLTCTPPQLR